MSLHQLQALRRGGHRPPTVTVIVGTPKPFDDGPGKVLITGDVPDLSPLVGLPVHVIDVQDDFALTSRVVAGLQAVDVTLLGICNWAGSCGVSADHEHAMQRYRETLCRN